MARALEAHYHHAATLEAVFLERYSEGHGGMRVESGRVYFSKPGRMRWDYESPQSKLFLVDGHNAWFYVPADRTASRAKVKESSDWRTPLALLMGKSELSHLCRSIDFAPADVDKEARPSTSGSVVLRCTPKDEGRESFHEILLEVDPSDHLVRVLVREPGDIETEFRFGNWQENIPLPESTFHFEPPEGVAIVDQSALAGAVH
ncbi:MAG: LolA family protein [Candidatus Acidiferrales bacterium]